MNKKRWIIAALAVVVLAVLFAPISTGVHRDGGTREYTALTYKIVDWNRFVEDGTYDKTKVYFFPHNFKSIDELWAIEEYHSESTFCAKIIEVTGSSVLVEPLTDEKESQSSALITFNVFGFDDIGAEVGSIVNVTYTGYIMETYPAQVNAVKWELAKDLRPLNCTEQWLDKETAEKYETALFSDIIITKIYANCFFAQTVIPMPYQIKINGELSEKWCVGDQVYVTYENTYYDKANHKVEADLLTVETSTFQIDPYACYKPVIYLYPEKELEVSVKLTLDGKLTCTYPVYGNGWTVTASPDGILTDTNGQTYNYLYWEGFTNAWWDMSEGFCVKGEDTAAFLEDSLAKLGLNRREANEFIVYWLPLMQENAYNIISFQSQIYEDAAKLEITPAPDTVIRVFMTWQAVENCVDIEPQELSAVERKGFTVVEWGGTEVVN